MIGKRFGRLTVIEKVGKDKHRSILWKCKCDCGGESIVRTHNLRCGNSTSCGCVRNDKIKKLNYKTGQYKSRIYHTWINMKTRCHTPTAWEYKNYGARGIAVCDEWRNNFQAFYDWANENGYRDDLTIERINNDGNYCPENCRWVDRITQNRNQRNTRLVTFNGVTKHLFDWADEFGIKRNTLAHRLHRGWSIDKSLTTPVKIKFAKLK